MRESVTEPLLIPSFIVIVAVSTSVPFAFKETVIVTSSLPILKA